MFKKKSNKEKVEKLLNYLFYWSPREQSSVVVRLSLHSRLITSGHRESIRGCDAGVDGRLFLVYEKGDALSAGVQLHRQILGEPAAEAVQNAFPLHPTCERSIQNLREQFLSECGVCKKNSII